MTTERYIKINTCNDCKYTGHSNKGLKNGFTFVCSNPLHENNNGPFLQIGKEYYPITTTAIKLEDNLIPNWCKLPKKCGEE